MAVEDPEEVEEPSEDRTVAASDLSKDAKKHSDGTGVDAEGTLSKESEEESEAPKSLDGKHTTAEGRWKVGTIFSKTKHDKSVLVKESFVQKGQTRGKQNDAKEDGTRKKVERR